MDRTPELLGTWQATQLLEGTIIEDADTGRDMAAGPMDTVDVRLDDVSLRFDPDGRYVYTSTLDYYEEGTYVLEGDYLTTAPSVDSVGNQRVRILTLDSLRLQVLMSEGGRRRQLEFERVDDGGDPVPEF